MSEDDAKRNIKIKGRVVDEKGRPIAGAKVVCDRAEVLTLFDGTFQFEYEVSETLMVEIEIDGYRKQRRQFDLAEGESDVLEFQLEPDIGSARIYGYVFDKERNRPIEEGGTVYLYRPTSNIRTMIDPNTGFYEFDNLPLGTYSIWTSVLDYQEQKMTLSLGEGEEKRKNFLLEKKEEEEVPWG